MDAARPYAFWLTMKKDIKRQSSLAQAEFATDVSEGLWVDASSCGLANRRDWGHSDAIVRDCSLTKLSR